MNLTRAEFRRRGREHNKTHYVYKFAIQIAHNIDSLKYSLNIKTKDIRSALRYVEKLLIAHHELGVALRRLEDFLQENIRLLDAGRFDQVQMQMPLDLFKMEKGRFEAFNADVDNAPKMQFTHSQREEYLQNAMTTITQSLEDAATTIKEQEIF